MSRVIDSDNNTEHSNHPAGLYAVDKLCCALCWGLGSSLTCI